MSLALPDDSSTARIPAPRVPRSWAESTERGRGRARRARYGRALAVLVVLAALAAAGVIWQLTDGRPLELVRDGLALLPWRPA